MPNIAIVWDFDGTLTPIDSTTKTVEIIQRGGPKSGTSFWKYVKGLRGDQKQPNWQHVLASDAPIWMYSLSRIAFEKRVPLNAEFFREFVLPEIHTYKNVISFLRQLKALERTVLFNSSDLKIHHFIVTAGLKDLVEQVFPKALVRWTFGCLYRISASGPNGSAPESIPVFCMDETMKTRSLFEISKGSFEERHHSVNRRVPEDERWAPFQNVIYIGDGDTDVPALSLVRTQGGIGIAVFNPAKSKRSINKRLKLMRLDKRADLITPANFSKNGELFEFLSNRCRQIALRYRAEKAV
jgi:hypothetical protein